MELDLTKFLASTPRGIALQILTAVSVLLLLNFVGRSVYRLTFHPLAKFPGPKLAAISDIWYAKAYTSGYYPFIIQKMHAKYGDVIRIAPNELSFAAPGTFKEIYNYATKDRPTFLKGPWYDRPEPEPSIVHTRDPADHSMQRKSLSHAFSAQSLRDDEYVVQTYVNLFIEQLRKFAGPGTEGINLSEAYNWVTFDIIGDLTFGESFNAVAEAKSNFWISLILDASYFAMISTTAKRIPILKLMLPFVMPKNAPERFKIHRKLTDEKLQKRIQQGATSNREDFFAHILRRGNFTPGQLRTQSIVLTVAGSETTSTFLSGVTYFLLKNPETLSKLRREVRSAFPSADDITGDATGQLPYLRAVVEEGLRLFPPAAIGLQRVSPGAVVDGHWIPAGTTVATDPFTAAHDSRNFRQPWDFRPERWTDPECADNKAASRPFSLGPRACIGTNLALLESRIVLAKVVHAFDLELLSRDLDWWRDVRFYMLWHKPKMMVRFHPRET
ncbi:cytochrome P450 [Biscogniauxia sp. FL1348]|nr:cytochrome P450 [Biscogniauxia sp. FL1348]